MSERNILQEYSVYLQMVSMNSNYIVLYKTGHIARKSLLTYEEFKEYYMRSLTGKDNYIDSLVNEFQFGMIGP